MTQEDLPASTADAQVTLKENLSEGFQGIVVVLTFIGVVGLVLWGGVCLFWGYGFRDSEAQAYGWMFLIAALGLAGIVRLATRSRSRFKVD